MKIKMYFSRLLRITLVFFSMSTFVLAQPSITPAPAAGKWDNFEATNSDKLNFEFALPVNTQPATVEIKAPPTPVVYEVRKGVAGPVCNDQGTVGPCDGSTVVNATLDVATSVLSIQVTPDAGVGMAGVLWVSLRTQNGSLGSWDVCPSTLAPALCSASTNYNVNWVHVIPDVETVFPAEVPSGQVGVTLDASSSAVVFEKSSTSSATPPSIVSYTFSLVDPGSNPCSAPTIVGSAAKSNAPTVAANSNCRFDVIIDDGTYNASEIITITVRPPANPVDAVLLLDTSGSMGWHRQGSAHDMQGLCCSRLAAAKVAANYFVDRLGTFASTSRVGVAIFPGEPAPSTVFGKRWYPPADLAAVAAFPTVKNNIGETSGCPATCAPPPGSPTGSMTGIPINWNGTPTQAGLLAAKDMLIIPPTTGKSRIIVLLSDGAHNTGGDPEDPTFLSDFVTNAIHVYTVGIGTGTDNVNFDSLRQISVNTGVGTSMNPIGFAEFNTGDVATDPNLIPHFEKILTDMVDLNFINDPVAAISRGETNTHTVMVTDHDSLVSFTVSWESTISNVLDAYVLSPSGQKIEAQLSANGYKNITVTEELLRHSGDSSGEWKLVVHFPASNNSPNTTELNYNYSVITKSTLNMRVRVDKDEYFTGDTMLLEAGLIENNRRLKGGTVEVNVLHPEQGIGNWHFANIVAAKLLESVPNEISGEPLSQLDKKNFILLQQNKIKLPKIILEPKLSLNDNGKDGDRYPHDGIYSGRFQGFSVPGVYRFRVAATGTANNGQEYTREMEFQKYVDILPDVNVTEKERAIENVNPDDGSAVMRISVSPFDAAKNYLGPGYADKIEIESSIGEPIGGVKDMLYGAYERKFRIGAADISANPNITIKVKGVVVNDGPIIPPPLKYTLEISGHLGYTFPHGNLSNNFDGGLSGMLDVAYRFTRSWSAEALFGYHEFGNKGSGNDFSWTHASLNGKYSYPVGLFRVYANGGGGWYVPETGDSGFGWNVGAGINYPLSDRLGVDLGYNYHHVSKGDRNEFSSMSLGIRYGVK